MGTDSHICGGARRCYQKWLRVHTEPVHLPLRMTDKATGSDVTPKGIPLGARMCNRKLGFPALFSGVYENMKKKKKYENKIRENVLFYNVIYSENK